MACFIWWQRRNFAKTEELPVQFQRLGYLNIAGAMRTTTSVVLEVILDVRRIHLKIKRKDDNDINRNCFLPGAPYV